MRYWYKNPGQAMMMMMMMMMIIEVLTEIKHEHFLFQLVANISFLIDALKYQKKNCTIIKQ